MTERWLPLFEWEGFYEISNLGRVRSITRTVPSINTGQRRFQGKILRQGTNPRHGYRFVNLCRDRTQQSVRVARLVLETFVGPCPLGMEALHWDDDKSNNHLSNLRWGTRSQNMEDRVRNGRHHYASRDYCDKGHLFDEENTLIRENGGRRCKACRKEYQRIWAQRKRQNQDYLPRQAT